MSNEHQTQDQTESRISACNHWVEEIIQTSRRIWSEDLEQPKSPFSQTNTEVSHGL